MSDSQTPMQADITYLIKLIQEYVTTLEQTNPALSTALADYSNQVMQRIITELNKSMETKEQDNGN